ncbi:Crp/Fnr family transcriptional regulator [Polaribacter sp. PL03]|uniref:Crp/Fnr family transcriptional regulator n=1 Tax=Polaribacter sp. PL03 TaxID=3088353 RepID=UPI0029CF7442|nr:Crp/Fnr family transcriptional regulator [Polaribacter sp. PL03]MDX6747854.1 Crp/Fnr family transcriptional regulator [Polaribacter sp. PL03]
MNNLKITLDKFISISEETEKTLFSIATPIFLKKGDLIAKAGEVAKNIYIIEQGIARSFYTDSKGKEYIRNLFTPTRAVGALGALILEKKSKFSYGCLSDCKLYEVNYYDFIELTKTNLEVAGFYSKILEKVFLELEAKVYDLSVLNGTERYLKIKEQIPDIENLIPQYHIASFLNITPVQLSRIRRELYSKK